MTKCLNKSLSFKLNQVILLKSSINNPVNLQSSCKVSSFISSKIFVNGEWVNSAQSKTFPVYNPANEEVLGEAADCDENDAREAIKCAAEAFKSWSKLTGKQRSTYLQRLYEIQKSESDLLAQLISLEMGKPLSESAKEIAYGASFFEWFAEEAKRLGGQIIQSSFPNTTAMFIREPLGPVGIITPVLVS